MRILIVESEPLLRELLCQGLTEAGFAVDAASDTRAGLHLAAINDYHLTILDDTLLGSDGWSMLRRIREIANRAPAMLLSGRRSSCDAIDLLAAGVDDVLPKPFTLPDVLTHARAILRTFAPSLRCAPRRLHVADLELDPGLQKSYRAGHDLALTRTEFSTLALLMERAGEVVDRDRIAATLWQAKAAKCSGRIDTLVGRLRRKVDGKAALKLLHTVRRVGFIVEARTR